MGLYVSLLTIVILLLWAYFLKFEFKQAVLEKPEEAAWFNEVKKEFGAIASSSKNFLNQAKNNSAQRLLLDKAKQELEKQNNK